MLTLAATIAGSGGGLGAQTAGPSIGAAPSEVRDLPRRVAVRFLTGVDYPPFNYFDEDNVLTGFNVDIARAICLEMGASCDVKGRPWNELLPALKRGDADAVIASHVINPVTLRQVDFTDRYYHTPGRFAARRKDAKLPMTPVGLETRKVGVVKGTAHEAFIRDFFRDSQLQSFANSDQARTALVKGKVDYIFDDAISLMFWLNGTASRACCEFRGGPFAEPKYFGDGVGIAVTKGDLQLRAQINKALQGIRASGRYEELFLQYFPLKVY